MLIICDENIMQYLALQDLLRFFAQDNIEGDSSIKEIEKRISVLIRQDPEILVRLENIKKRTMQY